MNIMIGLAYAAAGCNLQLPQNLTMLCNKVEKINVATFIKAFDRDYLCSGDHYGKDSMESGRYSLRELRINH